MISDVYPQTTIILIEKTQINIKDDPFTEYFFSFIILNNSEDFPFTK